MDESDLIPRVRCVAAKVFELNDPGQLGPDDDLLLHGLDSIKMAELAGELTREFDFDPLMESGEPMLDVEQLTVRQLARQIIESKNGTDADFDGDR